MIPRVREVITNSVTWDTVTAAKASSEMRLTQNASTNWYSVWKNSDSITGQARDQDRAGIEPVVRSRPNTGGYPVALGPVQACRRGGKVRTPPEAL